MIRRLAVGVTIVLAICLAAFLWIRSSGGQGPARLETVLPWPDQHHFGLSGLLVSADGALLTALSDEGYLIAATLERGPEQDLAAVMAGDITELAAPERATWPDTWLYSDSEGLALLPDGRIAVAFEALHRVTIFDTGGRPVEWIDVPPVFEQLATNAGVEAVTATADGTILAIPEDWEADALRLPVFSVTPPTDLWQIAGWIEAARGFSPVDLDIDAEGRLYLLERRQVGWIAFSSRIRRFRIEDGLILDEEILLQTSPGRHGNLEGLAIWSAPGGLRRAILVSDNNGNWLLRQQILEYRLPD